MNDRTDKWLMNLLWAAVLISIVIYIFVQYNHSIDKMYPLVATQYESNIEYSFNCGHPQNNRLWDCEGVTFTNLTGQYCNGTMICQNTWRYK